MFTQQHAELLAQKLPGDCVLLEQLQHGANSRTYLLRMSDQTYVVKTCQIEPDRLRSEFETLQMVDGLGPVPVLFDDSSFSSPVLVMEYVTGDHPEHFDTALATRMADWYGELHKNTKDVPEPVKRDGKFSLSKMAKTRICERYSYHRSNLPEGLRRDWDPFFDRVSEVGKRWESAFRRSEVSLVHSDPNDENIFYTDTGVRLVDWEYARFTIKEWDIAMFPNYYEFENDMTTEDLRVFKEHYGELDYLNVIRFLAFMSNMQWLTERLSTVQKEDMPEDVFASDETTVLSMLEDDVATAETLFARV